MDISKYNIYASISTNEKVNKENFDKVLLLIKKFDDVNNISNAKKIIEDNLDIKEGVNTYSIAGNCLINIKENDKLYSINFLYRDESITYSYKK